VSQQVKISKKTRFLRIRMYAAKINYYAIKIKNFSYKTVQDVKERAIARY